MENLTGHSVTIVDPLGEVLYNIPPSEREEPLRANYEVVWEENKDNIPIASIDYFIDVSQEKLDEIYWKYNSILVSKITAEALKKRGYKGSVFITGQKCYKDGKLLGVNYLSRFI